MTTRQWMTPGDVYSASKRVITVV